MAQTNTKRWLRWILWSVVLVALSGCAKSAPESGASASFKQGRELVTQGQYADAIPHLQQYQKAKPRGKHASRAGLFLGKAHLALGQFDQAQKVWEQTVRDHSSTLEGHKCRYKLAVLSMLRGNRADALTRFKALSDTPNGPLAPEATAFTKYLSK